MKSIRWLAAVAVALGGCGQGVDEAEEVGHAAADVMASLDETGTGGGFAWNVAPIDRPGFDRNIFDKALDLAMPPAYAAACWTERFGTCNAGVMTKSFDACALGGNKLEGSVTLTFSDTTCSLGIGSSVTRTADFTLTGRRNATLTVSAPGGGQRVTRNADGFNYAVLGMERIMKNGAGKTLFDIATKTDEDFVVKGLTRRNRVIQSGKLEIEHKLAGYTLTLVPENVTWDGTCNCPVSGKLTGTITGGKNSGDTASVEFQGCGNGTVTVGGEAKTVSFDRCAAL
jgi:hypothetical protein